MNKIKTHLEKIDMVNFLRESLKDDHISGVEDVTKINFDGEINNVGVSIGDYEVTVKYLTIDTSTSSNSTGMKFVQRRCIVKAEAYNNWKRKQEEIKWIN